MNEPTSGGGGAGGNSGIIGGPIAPFLGSPGTGGGGGSGPAYPSGGAGGGGGYIAPPVPPKFSFNKFVVAPYVSDGTIKTATTGKTGFAVIEQKVSVKGLRLLVDLVLDGMHSRIAIDGLSQSGPTTIKAGSTVFIREELLHTQVWAKAIYESEYIGKFILVDKQYIEFVQPL